MKQIQLCVPDDQAELFAEKLAALVRECNGSTIDHKGVVTAIFDTSIPIWERIKTVEDAIAYTGMTLPENIEDLPIDVQAMLKLRIICAAYNELTKETLDQFPLFTTSEWRYYPWFYFYTQKQIDEMDEEDRCRVVRRSYDNANASSGVAYANTAGASSHSYTVYGGRLCFKTEELAIENGKRFTKLWGQFLAFITEE